MALKPINETLGGGIEKSEIPALQEQLETILKDHPEKMTEALRLLKEALDATPEDTQEELKKLIADYESKETSGEVEYSIEGLRKLNESEIFELFFERPEMRAIYKVWISEKISKYPYLKEHQTTIELTVWKHLVDQLSMEGIMGYAGMKITDYMSGKTHSISEAFSPDAGEIAPEGIDGLTTLLGSLESVSTAFSNGEGEEEKVTGFVDNIRVFIEDISRDYFSNLEDLHLLLVEEKYVSEDGTVLNPELTSVLSNPFAASAIGKEGEYSDDNVNINLKDGIIQISPISENEIQKLQAQFLAELGETTSQSGNKIDGLRNQTKKIAGLLGKLGFDSGSLESFKSFLEGIPGVGSFLAAILGFFLNDSILSELDKIGMNSDQKKALENFEGFIKNPENTDDLPFTVRKENPGVLNGKEVRIIKSFISKIEGTVPGNEEEKQAKVQEILNTPKLAEIILTGKGIRETDTFLQVVHDTVSSMFEAGSKPTQKEFFEKLADISLVSSSDDSVIEEDILPPEEVVSLSSVLPIGEQILKTETLPTTLQLEGGEEVTLNLLPDEKHIIIGDKTFSIEIVLTATANTLTEVNLLEEISFSNGILKMKALGREKDVPSEQIVDIIQKIIAGENVKQEIPETPVTIKIIPVEN